MAQIKAEWGNRIASSLTCLKKANSTFLKGPCAN